MGTLRLILALSVVLNHCRHIFGFNLTGGALAVQAFFIISGFYMSLVLNEKYIGLNGSYYLFISNRFMRLFPIYFTVLLVSIFAFTLLHCFPLASSCHSESFVNPISTWMKYGSDMKWPAFVLLFVSNIGVFFQDVVMFLGIDNQGSLYFEPDFRQSDPALFNFLIMPQAWSIALELTFYLIAPFLVRKSIWFSLSIIVACMAMRLFFYSYYYDNDPWTYRFFPFELAYFLFGNFSYWLYKKIKNWSVTPTISFYVFGFILSLTIAYPVLKFTGSNYLYLTIFAACLPFVFIYTKKNKWDTYIGELSYPIYISHVLILILVNHFDGFIHKFNWFFMLAGVFAFSIVLNELIANKLEKLRQSRIKA